VKRRSAFIVLIATLLAIAASTACQPDTRQSATSTFAGQTLRIIVGFSQGGPYDVHARLLAAHLGKYLPGAPAVIVENMQGAASAVAARHLANVVKPDGLTIGLLTESNIADTVDSNLLGRLSLLGSPSSSAQLVVFSKKSGITSIDDWRRAASPPRFASTGPRSPLYVGPVVAGRALGLPVRMVTGYGNSAEARLALENGEADAVCLTIDAFNTLFRSSSEMRIVLRFSTAPIPGIDAPDGMALVSDPHAREILETGLYDASPFIRFYVAPLGVPAERLALLREGLIKAWGDPQLIAAATAAGLTIAPVAADNLERMLRTAAARPAIMSELRSLLEVR
jgi:tripartite-type tricarboxylate transporter receptor subunit TctC